MRPRVLIVDNYDSFTHNLAQAFGSLGVDTHVVRHDVEPGSIVNGSFDGVVISPGPGGPEETGACASLLDALGESVPVLGVCLGMQFLAWRAGARVVRAPRPMHGVATHLRHDARGLFRGLPQDIPVARYHSLAVDAASLPPHLVPTAWSQGVLMGLRSLHAPVEAIQFHPESVLTRHGGALLANFLGPRETSVQRSAALLTLRAQW